MACRLLEQWFPTGDIDCNNTEPVLPSWGLFQSAHAEGIKASCFWVVCTRLRVAGIWSAEMLSDLESPWAQQGLGSSWGLSWQWEPLLSAMVVSAPLLQPSHRVRCGQRACHASRCSLCFGIFTDKLKSSKVWKIAQKLFFSVSTASGSESDRCSEAE